MRLVECVPNFSEGRNRAVIEAISQAIRSVQEVTLLDVDPGTDTNRTVMTFVGPPESALEAAFRGISKSTELIDMSHHTGAHARLGACDVCPIVPVHDTSMQECVKLARSLGQRVAEQLYVPVYLYEEAATSPERRNLANIRKGEYEGLQERLKDPDWQPDFGKPVFNPKIGAVVIGAREFLIAFNFNLNTREVKIARRVAQAIREAGHQGKPGRFKHVKAVGWYMEEFQCAQVSMNLTNFKQTPLAEIFDEVCRQAEANGVRCTGSELVGLVPKECLLEVGRHYLEKSGKSPGAPEPELVRLAVQSLGLNELYPFDPEKKIIEYRIPDPRPLANLSLKAFVDETSSDSPAPGGGSVSALCGALSAALSCMVGQLTVGKKGYEKVSGKMKQLCETAQRQKDALISAVDDDTAAFHSTLAAMRMPKKTDHQKTSRRKAIDEATRNATLVPLEVLRLTSKVVLLALEVTREGLKSSSSDAGVAGLCAQAAAEGAYYNVMINLPGIQDQTWSSQIKQEAEKLLEQVRKHAHEISQLMAIDRTPHHTQRT